MLVLAALCLPRVQATAHLHTTIAVVGSGLVLWHVLLWWRTRRAGRALRIEPQEPRAQHFVQAAVQSCLYAYWGAFWPPMYAQLPLVLVQFAYVYAFDALFAWSRGRPWRLGTGPAPIVLSTNLFVWFRDDVFAWQFAMLTVGLLGKEFVKWTKDGRRTHVFNPSGLGLVVAATALVATGSSGHTWVNELAASLDGAPGIFPFLFCLGLVVQGCFGVTLMTLSAAVTMVAIDLVYTQTTGVYLFANSNLPAAAFLGLHLLMTDPSTSPKSHLGRTWFGIGYGVGYVLAFHGLGALGAPEAFAKLYPVPVLNVAVQWLDRRARGAWFGRLSSAWEGAWSAAATNRVHMAIWACVFAGLLGTGFLPTWSSGAHPGDSIPFWKRAMAEGRPDAARKLALVAGAQSVAAADPRLRAQATNELGILSLTSDLDPASEATRIKSAGHRFQQAAAGGCPEAVQNLVGLFLFCNARHSDDELARALRALEAAIGAPGSRRATSLVALACETGAGRPQDVARALELYRRCGDDLFAQKGTVRIALSPGALVDLADVVAPLTKAANDGDGECCYYLAFLHAQGRGVPADAARAASWFDKARELGFAPAVATARAADGTLPPWTAPRRRELLPPPWSTAFPGGAAGAIRTRRP